MVHLQRQGVTLVEMMVVAALITLVMVFLALSMRQTQTAHRHGEQTVDQQMALKLARVRLTNLLSQGRVTAPANVGEVATQLEVARYRYVGDLIEVDAQGNPQTDPPVRVELVDGTLTEQGAAGAQVLSRLGDEGTFTVERLGPNLVSFSITSGHHSLYLELVAR